MENEIEVYTKRDLLFSTDIFNGANLIKFARLVVKGHLEGTVSQFSYPGRSLYFLEIKSEYIPSRTTIYIYIEDNNTFILT